MAKFNINLQRNIAPPPPRMFFDKEEMQKAAREEFGYKNLNILQDTDVLDSEIIDKSAETLNPIFMPLRFDETEYTGENGQTVKLDKLMIPCAIVEFTMNKHIVTTQLASSKFKGDINELVGIGNWDVSIKGILAGKEGKYPSEEVQKLYRFFKCPVAIKVQHKIFELLEIHAIVMVQPALQNKQGFQNLQPFSISCISDEPVELVL